METSTATRLYAVIVLAALSAGCELAGDIFEAGVWVGVIMVVGIVGLVLFAMAKLKS
jgi:hypothetical protein